MGFSTTTSSVTRFWFAIGSKNVRVLLSKWKNGVFLFIYFYFVHFSSVLEEWQQL
jgi:hypothetical protein